MAKKKTEESSQEMVEIDADGVEVGKESVDNESSVDKRFNQIESDIEVEVTEEDEDEVEAPSKPDTTAPTMAAFDALIKKIEGINVNSNQVAIPSREPEESEEAFGSRFNEEVFKDDPYANVSKAVDRRTKKMLEEQVAPLLGSILEDAYENQVFRLRNDKIEGPIFDLYEAEIKKILATLPAGQQKNPQILKRVFENVKSTHVNEIVDLRVKQQMDGMKPNVDQKKKSALTEGGSSFIPSNGQKRTIRIPASELESLQKEASRKGVDVSVLIERRKAR